MTSGLIFVKKKFSLFFHFPGKTRKILENPEKFIFFLKIFPENRKGNCNTIFLLKIIYWNWSKMLKKNRKICIKNEHLTVFAVTPKL
jgi:hypothetical protein